MYPVFRNNSWIDYNDKDGESGTDLTLENRVRGTVWSVDNPAVWKELRPCVELSSQILSQAVRDPWCVFIPRYSYFHETPLTYTLGFLPYWTPRHTRPATVFGTEWTGKVEAWKVLLQLAPDYSYKSFRRATGASDCERLTADDGSSYLLVLL